MPHINHNKLLKCLNQNFGYSNFKGHQEAIITSILKKNDVLVLLPTGGGKSLCYQIPALMSDGMVIVISPLISLIDNQVYSLLSKGIIATRIHSNMPKTDRIKSEYEIQKGECKICYISPEMLISPRFYELIKDINISLFAIDEAHCISMWGYDFRPSYLKIGLFINLFPKIPRMALTATATTKIQNDIIRILGLRSPNIYISSFNRDNIFINVRNKKLSYSQLGSFILRNFKNQSGVIYSLTRKRTEKVSDHLKKMGFNILPYHGGMNPETKNKTLKKFLEKDTIIISATNAFGMGVDKNNIRFIIHLGIPMDLESYYQEIGRAGRDQRFAESWLFYNNRDYKYHLEQISNANISNYQKKIKKYKLQLMLAYANSSECRKKNILNYFNEKNDHVKIKKCCDNCWFGGYKKDLTNEATDLLKTICQYGHFLNKDHITSIVSGELRLGFVGHNHLENTTINMSKKYQYSTDFWTQLIYQLILKDFIIYDVETDLLKILSDGHHFLNFFHKSFSMFSKNINDSKSQKINYNSIKEYFSKKEIDFNKLFL